MASRACGRAAQQALQAFRTRPVPYRGLQRQAPPEGRQVAGRCLHRGVRRAVSLADLASLYPYSCYYPIWPSLTSISEHALDGP